MRYLIALVLLIAVAMPAIGHADEEFERNRVFEDGWTLATLTIDYTVPAFYAGALHSYCTTMTVWYWDGTQWDGWFKNHPNDSDLWQLVGGETYWVYCQR